MESPQAYIPIDRRWAMARGTDLDSHTSGAALFADISGFTPLTDALVRSLGPQRGADELPRQLNRIYEAVITEVDRYGGSVIGFSGDAITCWFEGDTGLQATASALAIQQVMEQFSAVAIPDGTTVALTIKVTVAAGPARRFVVGSPEIQLIDVLGGSTLERLAAAEYHAKKGDVVLDPQAYTNLAAHVTVRDWRSDEAEGSSFAVVDGLMTDVLPAPWPPLDTDALIAAEIRPWLLPPVYERLQSGLGEFLTELRPAVALFLRFTGIDYDHDEQACEKLDTYIRWVQAVLVRFGGFLIQLTIGDKGSYLYAAFGAPVAHDDDATRAVAAALELRSPPGMDFIKSIQIGISRGRMRTGAYGGPTARTYGVLGPETNMAARLMQHAPLGQIFVSHAVQKETGNTFVWESLPPLKVKGKAELVTVYRLIAAQERQGIHLQEPRYGLPMVGREVELKQAEQQLETALRGQGQIIAITAEAGMGKSRLVAEIIGRATARNVLAFGGECQSYGTNNSYLVWKSIWQAFFNVDSSASLADQARALETQLAAIDPVLVRRTPLLGMVLNVPIPDNDLTHALDAKLRKASLEALLVDCLHARAKTTPLLLVLEDCHWLDPLSHDLLEAIGRGIADLPVLIVVAYRPSDSERLHALSVTQLPYCTVMQLSDFKADEAARLIILKLAQLSGDGAEPPAPLVERITERAQGNPFYIEELLNYFHDQGVDPRNADALAGLDLPTNLHSLILSRIDQLTESQKLTVKVASIIGRLFRLSWLWGVHPELGQQERVLADLASLSRLDLTPLDQPEPEFTYLFKHIITREVAYESLPFAMRELLHEQMGQFIERTYSDALGQHVDLLAYHYDRSRNVPKRCEYLRKAGEAAQAAYANDAAISYYQRLLPHLTHDELRQQTYARLGEVLSTTAQYDAALGHLREALNLAIRQADHEAEARACRWISYVYELQSEFALALEWIQRGLDALGDQETVTTAELLAIAGLIATRQGNYDQAAAQCERSIEVAGQLGATTALAFASNARAIVFRRYGNYRKAIDYFNMAADLYQKANNIHGQGMSFNGIANTYSDLGSWTAASTYAIQARRIFVQTGDQFHRIFVDNNLGEIARDQGRLDEALSFYQDALHSLVQLGGSLYMITIVHINLGATFIRRSELEKARHHLSLAQANINQTRSRDLLPALHMYLAEAALGGHELVEAEAEARQALTFALDLGMRGEEGMIRRVLGEIAAASGNVAQAETCLANSITILNEVGQEYEAARSHLALARVYFKQDKLTEGIAALSRCRPVFLRLDAVLELTAASVLHERYTKTTGSIVR